MQYFPLDYPPTSHEIISKYQCELTLDESKEKEIRQLKLLLAKSNITTPEDELFLLQFLRTHKFDAEKSAARCVNFFRKVNYGHHHFKDIDWSSLKKKVVVDKFLGLLPHRDDEGCIVFVILAGRWDPNAISAYEFHQAMILAILQIVRSPVTQVTGFKLLIHCAGIRMQHALQISVLSILRFIDSVQNCLPCRIKGVINVKESAAFSYLWSITKLFVKKKLRKRFYLLGDNFGELHKIFPASMLPEEFGGTNGPFSIEPWERLMQDCEQYYNFVKEYGYAEITQ